LKGHGFSRAASGPTKLRALAPEGRGLGNLEAVSKQLLERENKSSEPDWIHTSLFALEAFPQIRRGKTAEEWREIALR
jgi:hypothetical protein